MSVPTAGGLLADVAAFVSATAEPSSADRPVRLATVDPAYVSGWPKVKFDGESTLSGKTYPHVDSYAPAKNDRVVLVPVGTSYLIVGAVSATSGGAAGLPAGSIVEFGGSTAPGGWLLCDGSAVLRTTYARLFAAISTTWGVGNGSTTFNVPDFRGRTPIGAGAGSGLTARTVAASGGAETVVLDSTTMPAHSHTFTGSSTDSQGSHGHTLSGSVGSGGGHSHSGDGAVGNRSDLLAGGGTNAATNAGTGSTSSDGSHGHSLSGSADSVGGHSHTSSGSNSSTGSGGAHENMPPWRAVHYIIKI